MSDNHPSAPLRHKAEAHGASAQELRKIGDWLFALLRFAITKDQADRVSVMALAYDMDGCGSPALGAPFSFFARTGATFCDDVAATEDPEKLGRLCRFIGGIDDDLLRRAFKAVLQVDRLKPSSPKPRHDREDLFEGLPPRMDVAEFRLRRGP